MQHTRPDNSASSAILNADQVYIDRTEPSALIAQFVRLGAFQPGIPSCASNAIADIRQITTLMLMGLAASISPRLATT